MNNIFDIKRFGNYFLYDLRRGWNNYGISLLLLGIIPALIFLVFQFVSLISGDGIGETPDEMKFLGIFLACIVVFFGAGAKLYGFVTEKRAGSDFLMLPASTLEKWLSMAVIVCIVLPVILFALLFATDGLMGLVFPTAYGDRVFSLGLGREFHEMLASEGITFNFPAIIFLSWCENILVFTLGAICFKKAKVAKTLLCLMLFGMACSALMVAVLGTADIDPQMFTEYFSSPDKAISTFNWTISILFTLIIGGLLGGIYYRLRTLKH